MYEKPLEEKLDELIGMIRVLDTKINFLQEDIQEIKDFQLEQVKLGLETLITQSVAKSQESEAKNWKVERL
jgi:hypothetical protein